MTTLKSGLLGCVILTFLFSMGALHADENSNPVNDQNLTLKVGHIFFSRLDSSFLADTGSGPLSTNIDFSRDLNMEDSQGSFMIEGIYQLSTKSRIDFTYYEIERDGGRTLNRDITFGGQTFLVNTPVESQFNYTTLIATYSYLLHSHDEIDIGVTAGLHINELELALAAPSANLSQSVTQLTPLPVFGLLFNYDLTPKLTLNYQSRVFVLNYEDIRGNLTDTKLTLEHHTTKNFGFEIGFNRRSGELEVREPGVLKKSSNVATGWITNLIWYF